MKQGKLFKRITAITSAAVITFGTTMIAPTATAESAEPDNYAKLLQYSLYFYDANFCGDISAKTGLSWRGNCHTSDEVPGGFHDAGDHAMFGLPQGYTASTLGWSYYEFKDAFDSTGQTEHLKLITDHFCDFFKRSTKLNGDSVSNFLYQKGDGGADHSYWGAPENQSDNRQMYWTSNGASDIAAEYAAALAVNYINFGNEEDLKYAEALYKFSTQYNQVATYGPEGFYSSSGCRDDQAWAAGWLYLATNKEQYKNDCASKQTPYLGWIHGWDNVDMGAACLYSHITGDWSKPNSWMSEKANGSNYFFLDLWGSARLNCSMQMTALISQINSGRNYADWCKGQMNYILGDNPANTCFVVGYAPNSASRPHHRACSGTSSDKDESPSKYTLVGALVGGPTDAGGTYQDSRADYQCNEVACDYNAALVGAAAGLYTVYKTGSTVSSIEGVTKIYGDGTSNPIVSTTTVSGGNKTTTTTTAKPITTTTTTVKLVNAGEYEIRPNLSSSSISNDNFPGWLWSEFGIPEDELAYKVEATISSDSTIGTWNGAFGSTINVSDWYQSENFNEYHNSNTATAVWNIDSDTSKIINYKYGTLKVGFWWLSNNNYKLDSIKVYTAKSEAVQPETTTSTTTTTTTTTTKPTTTTTTSTTTTKPTTTTTTSTTTTKPTTTTTTSTTTTKPTTTTTTSTTTKKSTTTTTTSTTTKKSTTTTTTSTITKKSTTTTTTSTTTKKSTTTTTTSTTTKKSTTTTTTSTTTKKSTTTTSTTTKKSTTTTTTSTTTKKSTTTTTTSTTTKKSTTTTTTSTTTTKPTTTTTTSTTTKKSTTTTTTTTPAPKPIDGDANGDGTVELSDAVLILQALGNPDEYHVPESQLEAADVYERGSGLTLMDALTIQRYLLKIVVSLPVK